MSDDLVDRLRAKKVCIGFKSGPSEDGGHMVCSAQYGPDPLAQAAAAELTRLHAQVAAGDKLAGAVQRLLVHEGLRVEELQAALSAYEGEKG